MDIVTNITLDFAKQTFPVVVFAKQYDYNSRKISITPLNNGLAYSIEEGITARIQATKPDGKTVINDCTIENGKIIAEMTAQFLTVAGRVKAEIGLYQNDYCLSTQIFYIEVEESAYNAFAVESSDEYGFIEGALVKAKDALEIAEEALEKAENAGGGGTGGSGVGIADVEIDENGFLIVRLTNGDIISAGKVVGEDGADGVSVVDASIVGELLNITLSTGEVVIAGKVVGPEGKQGPQGEPGYTPQKGIDYWTPADKQEILDELNGTVAMSFNQQGYVEGGNGWYALNTDVATAKNTGYVEIPSGYTHIKANVSTNQYGWAVLFATGNGSGQITDPAISVLGKRQDGVYDYFVPIPSNAKFVCVSSYSWNESQYAFFANEEEEEKDNEDIFDGSEFALFKQWGIVGDSLSVGHTADSDGNASSPNYYYSWGQYMARRMGNKCLNFGRSGVSSKDWMTTEKGYPSLIKPENLCQCYILALGANDTEFTLGSIADVDFDNMENNADTEYGHYAKVINAIRTTAPQAPVFLFTLPYPRNTDEKVQAINGMIRELAADSHFTNVYLVDLDADYNDYFKEGKLGNCIGNTGWHLTSLGYLYASIVNEIAISKVMAEHASDFQDVFEIPYGESEEENPVDGKDGVGIASIEQTTTSTADGGENVLTITLTNEESTTFKVRNGKKGSKGEKGDSYVLTESDKSEIASSVKSSFATETWTFELEDGSTVNKVVVLG